MLSFLFPLLLCAAATVAGHPSDPIILINCGSASSSSNARDGRTWNGDSTSKFLSSTSQNSSATSATHQDPTLISKVPYMTARISPSKLTYTFPISPGPKFIRLYFYPTTYSSSSSSSSNFDASNSYFSVTANNFTLLNNFSASLHLLDYPDSRRVAYLIKEFVVTVHQNQTLNLTFTPSPSSLAFINGIEIVAIPDHLYIKDKDQTKLVNYQNMFFTLDDSTALAIVYRLNVGGGDTRDKDLFRRWEDDSYYVDSEYGVVPKASSEAIKYTQATPNYTAPPIVYQTARSMGADPKHNLRYNLTWSLSVDSGFYYLVRLHFCETHQESVNGSNQRVFSIFINNMTAEPALDVFNTAVGNNIPVYKDYIVSVPEGDEGKQDLWIALHPLPDVIYADAILNGVEILKLNNSNGDLSGLNPELPNSGPGKPPAISRNKGLSKYGILTITGAVLGASFVLALVICFFVYRRKAKKDQGGGRPKSAWLPSTESSSFTTSSVLLLPTDLCRQFGMPEIRTATRNFAHENVVGYGGFGTVYKGVIEDGSVSVPVAIKRLESSSKQGTREFHTEIQMLSKLRHAHLVSLIGYCDDEDEMILVYEFMENGNLQDHIYKAMKIPPGWKQRLRICIGAAKGLHYLHTGMKHAIIHRDVKSSNILLDSNWVAKVSDFGLSKMGPMSESQTHVSTNVRGSFGYLDPEYYRRQQLTEKSDVYSFGVVLLEVVFARPPIVSTLTREQVNLIEWAKKCSKKGTIEENIDPQLKDDIAMISLNKYIEIAEICVRDKALERPTMSDVLWGLEFCLQLQESSEKNVNDGDDTSDEQKSSNLAHREVITTDDESPFTSSSALVLSSSENSCSNNISTRAGLENVFSEITNPKGR